MKILVLETTDARINLATEEYLLKYTDDEYFMLWRNKKSVIIGKNQNAYAEIDREFAVREGISVVRRITGGGAVFHDLGNVNFTFILRGEEHFSDYSYFTEPVIEYLKTLGVTATLSGRNDMLIQGKKFSGNAECIYKNRILHHGTIMLGADVSEMTGVLNPDPLKIQSKGIKSVKSRVTNINEHLKNPLTPEEFINGLKMAVAGSVDNAELITLDPLNIPMICELVQSKYSTFEYNFGFKQSFSVSNRKRFDGGILECKLNLSDNKISEIKFFGDFFSKYGTETVEQLLVGAEYNPKIIDEILSKINVDDYFSSITLNEVLSVMF